MIEDQVAAQPARLSYSRIPTKGSHDIVVDGIDLSAPDGSWLLGGFYPMGGAELRLLQGHRYALVGRNGVGKSTLLRAIASGSLPRMPSFMSVVYVEQELPGGTHSVLRATLGAVPEVGDLLDEEDQLLDRLEAGVPGLDEELCSLYDRQADADIDRIRSRASAWLLELGFDEDALEKPIGELSGGWRMRATLAACCVACPDVLLLDEPTNHLEGILWLEGFLNTYPGTVVVVSHDRAFLNAVVTDVILFRYRELRYYPGDFDAYVEQRTASEKSHQVRLAEQERVFAQAQVKIEKIRQVQRSQRRKWASKSKTCAAKGQGGLIHDRVKKMEHYRPLNDKGKRGKMTYDGPRVLLQQLEPESVLHFVIPEPPQLRDSAAVSIQVQQVRFAWPGSQQDLLRGVDMDLRVGCRVCIVGANGSGKTTLLRLLTGNLTPSGGRVHLPSHARVAYFEQHHVEQLQDDLDATPLQHLATKWPAAPLQDLRDFLGRFNLGADHAVRPIRTLSGGERTRLALASVVSGPTAPHFLVLDEVTHHLDYESCQTLITALEAFAGGLVIVSHDQYFVNRMCAAPKSQLYHVGSGSVRRLDSFAAYRAQLVQRIERVDARRHRRKSKQ